MARGSRTPLTVAAEAKALAETGHTSGQITTGLAVSTVDDIVNGRGRWGEVMRSNHEFQHHRDGVKRTLQTASLELATKALRQVEEKLPQASAAQAVVIYGVLRDKERLDAGEPSELHAIAVRTSDDIRSLDAIGAALGKALLARQQNAAGAEHEAGPLRK